MGRVNYLLHLDQAIGRPGRLLAANIQRGPGDLTRFQSPYQGLLIDNVPARCVDQAGCLFHFSQDIDTDHAARFIR